MKEKVEEVKEVEEVEEERSEERRKQWRRVGEVRWRGGGARPGGKKKIPIVFGSPFFLSLFLFLSFLSSFSLSKVIHLDLPFPQDQVKKLKKSETKKEKVNLLPHRQVQSPVATKTPRVFFQCFQVFFQVNPPAFHSKVPQNYNKQKNILLKTQCCYLQT